MFLTMNFIWSLTSDEIIAILEEDDGVIGATIYTAPPDNHELCDGDGRDEDCEVATINNNLYGNQLRSEAEVQVRKVLDNGVQ